jgi:hypothetical protein
VALIKGPWSASLAERSRSLHRWVTGSRWLPAGREAPQKVNEDRLKEVINL